MPNRSMKAFFREPLVHFLLFGGVIFAVHAWRGGDEGKDDLPRIEVTAGTLTWLSEGFARQWHRPPDERELRGLVEDHVREEVLYREALAMGLDRDDTIVRRRLAQKLEFLGQDIASAAMPDEAALRRYFAEHAARYAVPGQVSFRHVYFSADRRGAMLEADARNALEALAKGGDAETMGDPFLREHEFVAADESQIASALGDGFAKEVIGLPAGEWQGPVSSTYGMHLVQVSGREAPRPAAFETVREAVVRDFSEENRLTANRDFIRRLKERYRIAIDEAALSHAATPSTETATR